MESFKNFCNDLNPKKKTGDVFRSLKNFKKSSLGFGIEEKKQYFRGQPTNK